MKHKYKLLIFLFSVARFYRADAQTELTYYTSMGNFKIMLTDTLTPRTVDSFKSRVTAKFYDGLIFHRVIDNFMIQGGDPLGTGMDGPGYSTPDEFVSSLKNVPGALAMANSGPNTNGSQFYINLVNNTHLNNHYTVLGMVTSGFSVVQSIGHVATNTNDKPLTNVVIDSIRITRFPTAIRSINNRLVANVYPNPNKGIFTIELPATPTEVAVLNMEGKLVYRTKSKGMLKVDLQNLPAGMYLLRISNMAGVGESRLVIE